MRPRFLSQKIAQKEPEKKIPSTAANATQRSAKEAFSGCGVRRGRIVLVCMSDEMTNEKVIW
jgi:hypothetical protein